ncbi:HPP family protein [Candidatus Undinarchaeota archaeon]
MPKFHATVVKGISVFVTIAIIIYFLGGVINQPLLLAAICSTTFAIYFRPRAKTSQLRNVFGGHMVSALSGFILVYLFSGFLAGQITDLQNMILLGAMSVTVASMLMEMFDVEHPPAAGTALTFAFSVKEAHIIGVLFVALAAVVLISLLRGAIQIIEKKVIKTEHKIANWIEEEIFEHVKK